MQPELEIYLLDIFLLRLQGGVEEVLRRASATVGISVYEHGVASGNSDREEVSSILLMQERRNC